MRPPQSITRPCFVPTLHLLTVGFVFLLGTLLGIAVPAHAQVVCTPTPLRFRAVDLGQSETFLVKWTNNGSSSVTVENITSTNRAFTVSGLSLPLTLGQGQSVDVSVNFAPVAKGWTTGTISLANGSTNLLSFDVYGGGVTSEALAVNPPTVSFGQVAVGASSTVPVVITNNGASSIRLFSIQMAGNGFSVSGPQFPLTLHSGASATLDVTFNPQATGSAGGSMGIVGAWMAVPLSGIGTGSASGKLVVAPSPLNFGNVPVGTTDTQSLTMNAVGADVTVSSAASSNSQFVLNGASFPFTIPQGQSVSFNVAFTPSKSGSLSASMSFVSNAATSNTVESMTGSGTNTPYSVNLWWNASSDVAGYNVYRSNSANGSYSKINSSLTASTAYSDSTVISGTTYYYAATAVNSSGQESPRSAPVQAVIP